MTSSESLPRGRFGRLARRMTPWGFPLVYLGWAYVWWAPIVGSDQSVWTFPNVALFVVGGLSPLLAALLLSWLTEGGAGIRDLGHRLIDLGRIDARWALLVLLYWPIFNLLVAGAALLVGVTSDPLEFISTDRLFDPAATAAIVAFAFVFPLVEEIGLRGYWLDRLQERFSALTAGVINGTTWGIWHAPFVLFPGYYANTTFDPDLSWWIPSIVLGTLVTVWVYNNTRRSILAVLCFHAFGNMTGEVMGFAPEMYPFVLVGYGGAALIVVLAFGPYSFRGWETPLPRPEDNDEPISSGHR
ncbi:Membrane protease YdiL, CAAX protease family [Halobiforma haloterrestris]|uniref:Membrane protease YdiL, CAAX protease family n=1 Tax=Natronobacterium haloterrestre TaxID=148448 RepID=A0A1I1GC94_NATHA|nr:CPBP family intramembrane glutamic endopeptidase [Halobiforma haloterrestris]SFC08912.1 Membrane protease YdiL, CAAX protease family [Halobiforma haloterrestris]